MTTMKIIYICGLWKLDCESEIETVRETELLLFTDEQQQLSKLKCQLVYSCIFMTGWWFDWYDWQHMVTHIDSVLEIVESCLIQMNYKSSCISYHKYAVFFMFLLLIFMFGEHNQPQTVELIVVYTSHFIKHLWK